MDQKSSNPPVVQRVQTVPAEPGSRYYVGGRQIAVPQRRIVPTTQVITQRHPQFQHVVAPRPQSRMFTPPPVSNPVKYVQSTDPSRARYPRNTDKSRGLRHFSSRVCEKVKEKVQTNYNEVADELVTEYFESMAYPPTSHEKQMYDSKNIRRRVYDALNVLMAMNIIEKEKKEIRWVGLPTSSVAERRRLEDERNKRKERIRQKTEQMKEYIIQLVAYKSLVNRNRENERKLGRPSEQSILYLPFIIINTERKTYIDCAISQDKTEYAMTFDRPFEIHDDIEVLKRLGLTYGLEAGAVSGEKIEGIKACLPPALRVYVDSIIEDKNDSLDKSLEQDEEEEPEELQQPLPAPSQNTGPSPAKIQRYVARPVKDSPQSYVSVQSTIQRQSVVSSRSPTIQRSYVQRPLTSVSSRYVQPSQSASFQAATRTHGRQVYVVQSSPQNQRYVYTRHPVNYGYIQPSSQVVSEPATFQEEEFDFEESEDVYNQPQ
ncbi:unnamed protein product [Bursaphelenchus xylophilus]|uniref:(pine wood nematode) hypothetical protein n=1 Tax=Bursaphelenchus xylophilus TaxID=6326 RepID=A0A1I7RR24_BURXY|nr:unnamed protein product [Bursaphelenchus xylophilus]CAG9130814.1 unnamed protein product [Bursaphelenchus xylophilus]